MPQGCKDSTQHLKRGCIPSKMRIKLCWGEKRGYLKLVTNIESMILCLFWVRSNYKYKSCISYLSFALTYRCLLFVLWDVLSWSLPFSLSFSRPLPFSWSLPFSRSFSLTMWSWLFLYSLWDGCCLSDIFLENDLSLAYFFPLGVERYLLDCLYFLEFYALVFVIKKQSMVEVVAIFVELLLSLLVEETNKFTSNYAANNCDR